MTPDRPANASPAQQARILVCTDQADDAEMVLDQIRGDFEHIRASTVAAQAVQDAEAFRPDVLVLGFDSLDKNLGFFQALRRGSPALPHCKTVVLCHSAEVPALFALCKQGQFDDYVLYWPHAHDSARLAMSLWTACRNIGAKLPDLPGPADLLDHRRRLGDLERRLDRDIADGSQHLATARTILAQVEQELAGAIDACASQLLGAGLSSATLAQALDGLKQQQRALTRRIGADSIEPFGDWLARMQTGLALAWQDTRALTDQIGRLRPLLLVVEDDAFICKLIGRMLGADACELQFAGDGSEALDQIRKRKPDLILMDMRLPGLDGLALTRRLKAAPHLADIPVVIMTGDARRETLLGSIEAGAADFVVKPFSREALTAKLDRILPRGLSLAPTPG